MKKLKLSSFLMERTPCQQISRKLKRKQKQKGKGIDGTNKQAPSDDADIDKLADELLVHILSRLSLKEAARTCVLARRWRYLWRSVFGTLQFDFRDIVTAAGDVMEVEKFVSWVNTVLELHQGRYIEGIVVIFCKGMHEKQVEMMIPMARTTRVVDSWVYFAVQKELERFELHLPYGYRHKFPSIEMLKSHSHGGSSPFRRLKILRLLEVPIEDEVVHYFLASCPNLEQLFIYHSIVSKDIRVVDPPSLRVLEIKSWYLESLEISAESLVSLAYVGPRGCDLKKVPNLHELTIGDDSFLYFISEPNSRYSNQLVKLVVDLENPSSRRPLASLPDSLPQLCSLKRLEVKVGSLVGRSLLFFTSLIKASPQLCEFRIEIRYWAGFWGVESARMPFPAVEDVKYDHTSLKVVEMCGYVGCSSDEELLVELVKNVSSMERVVIDTESEYYDDPDLAFCIAFGVAGLLPEMGATTRTQSKERAKLLVSTFRHHIHFIVQ